MQKTSKYSTITELVEDLKSQFTTFGDSVKMWIVTDLYKTRPTIFLEFKSFNKELLKNYNPDGKYGLNITDWLPNEPWSTDPITGQRSGFENWRDFIFSPSGFGREIQGIIESGGRVFSFEEVQ